MHMGLLNVCECILYRHCCVSQSCFSLLPTDSERCVSSVSCTLPVPAHCLVGVRFYPLWGSAGWSSICQHLPLHQQGGKGQLQRTIHIFLFFELCAKLHFIFNPFTDTYTLCKCHNDYFRRFRSRSSCALLSCFYSTVSMHPPQSVFSVLLQTEDRHREFSMAAASVGDSLGITVAGLISLPVHTYFCSL